MWPPQHWRLGAVGVVETTRRRRHRPIHRVGTSRREPRGQDATIRPGVHAGPGTGGNHQFRELDGPRVDSSRPKERGLWFRRAAKSTRSATLRRSIGRGHRQADVEMAAAGRDRRQAGRSARNRGGRRASGQVGARQAPWRTARRVGRPPGRIGRAADARAHRGRATKGRARAAGDRPPRCASSTRKDQA